MLLRLRVIDCLRYLVQYIKELRVLVACLCLLVILIELLQLIIQILQLALGVLLELLLRLQVQLRWQLGTPRPG